MSHAISQSMLPEFDREMGSTRQILERLPEAHLEWRPHVRSRSMRELASHLANMTFWAVVTLSQDDFDMRPPDGPVYRPFEMTSVADSLANFDENLRQARALLDSATDETMMRTWTLKAGGTVVVALPKVAAMRSFVMNHMIHHRAQLGVYLRLTDVPVPGFYGPSADER